MLVRYWRWTSANAQSGVPHGPLRYRAWTSLTVANAAAGVPFGPLRFRAWTSGSAAPPETPAVTATPGYSYDDSGWREYIEAQHLPDEARELVAEAVERVVERAREPTRQRQEQAARDIAALQEAFDREGVAWAQYYGSLLARIRGWIEAETEALRLAELSLRMEALDLVRADIAAAIQAVRTRNDNAIRALLMMM